LQIKISIYNLKNFLLYCNHSLRYNCYSFYSRNYFRRCFYWIRLLYISSWF